MMSIIPILNVQAFFDEIGVTGARDAVVYEMARRGSRVTEAMGGWMCDPYDPGFTKGFRMNISESPEFDSPFPSHPLSVLRKFIVYFVSGN